MTTQPTSNEEAGRKITELVDMFRVSSDQKMYQPEFIKDIMGIVTTLVEQARGETSLLSFRYHKGEMDFGVNGTVTELTYEQMKELREMIVVGIGQLESMWRDSRPNLAARTISSDSKNV